jgi:hypothetical protein
MRREGVTGDVAQLGERRLCKADVRGSSPLISTGLAQVVTKEGRLIVDLAV